MRYEFILKCIKLLKEHGGYVIINVSIIFSLPEGAWKYQDKLTNTPCPMLSQVSFFFVFPSFFLSHFLCLHFFCGERWVVFSVLLLFLTWWFIRRWMDNSWELKCGIKAFVSVAVREKFFEHCSYSKALIYKNQTERHVALKISHHLCTSLLLMGVLHRCWLWGNK